MHYVLISPRTPPEIRTVRCAGVRLFDLSDSTDGGTPARCPDISFKGARGCGKCQGVIDN